MKLEQLKEILTDINTVRFQLPNGLMVPIHFHVTEVGLIQKNSLIAEVQYGKNNW